MKKNLFSNRPVLFFLKAPLMLLLLMSLGFASANVPTDCISCQAPSPGITAQTSNSVDFAWLAVSGATGYEVKYTKTGGFSSGVQFTSGTSISYTNLSPGTYTFYLRTVCGGSNSDWIIVTEDIIMI